MRILFLYTELADYTLACLRELKRSHKPVEILVIHYPVNPEAPFQFHFGELGQFRSVNEFADFDLFIKYIREFKPQKVVCSGWISRWYVRACRLLRKDALCIVCSDNQWRGSLKQYLMTVVSRVSVRKIFGKIWIPGRPQYEYARRIGYEPQNILTGFYSCDVAKFNSYYEQSSDEKQKSFPHVFLTVARYIPAKGYHELWNAFAEWKKRTNNDWELWCAGTGEGFDTRKEHPAIRHLGFIQKETWNEIISKTGVFVLASLHEPWGVAVHEFAAAGFPLLLSKEVGAADAFLKHNGYRFDPQSREELIACFDLIANKNDKELVDLGRESYNLSHSITPQQWAHSLLTVET